MSALPFAAGWQARLQAAVVQPPRRAREALCWRGERIGSVEPDLFARAGLTRWLAHDSHGWHLQGELDTTLAAVAAALREAGLAKAWRDELLAVRNPAGTVLGAIERAAVRPLGIATTAVHLLARDPEGRHWVQQRALDKDTDPGLWDTLVGGMVPARDSVPEALARETWEEAGLRLEQVQQLRHGGRARTERGCGESLPHGYVVEDIEWFTCVLPEGVRPHNQDGEVAAFATLAPGELAERLAGDEFTLDAGLAFASAFGRRHDAD